MGTLKNRKATIDLTQKYLKMPVQFGTSVLYTNQTTSGVMAGEGYGEGKGALMIKACRIICQVWWSQFDGIGMHGCQWNWVSAVF